MSIKNIIQKTLNIFGYQISSIESKKKDPNHIQHSEYISKDALIIDSEITGKVIVNEGVMIYKTRIISDSIVEIGRYTSINGMGTEIQGILNPITIGNFCSIARGVSIQENNHNISTATTYYIKKHIFKEGSHIDSVSKGAIHIGNDVWIGGHSTIVSGITIGDGAVVGANSVVTKDVPPYAIVAGNPAKILRYRFSDEIIAKLLETQWWIWDLGKIIRNKSFFSKELSIEDFTKIIG